MSVRAAFAALGMPPERFLLRYAIPLAVASVLASVALRAALAPLREGPLGAFMLAFPALVVALLAAYPFLRAAEAAADVDRSMHVFITHVGVLATSNLPRAEIFRIIGAKSEYGRVATEARRVHALVTRWHLSLSDAARFVSRRTPSRLLSDFLARLAHALDSGEDMTRFLANEQAVVMQDYANAYRRKLYAIEVFKAIYNGLVMSLAFLFLFAMLIPVLVGVSTSVVLGVALAVVVAMEVAFVRLARSRAPADPLWHDVPTPEGAWRRAAPAIVASVALALVLLVACVVLRPPPYVAAALVIAPLSIAGFRVARLEAAIERREDNYGAFVRSLGASAAAHGGQVKPAVRQLRHHDFGPLRDDVTRLHRRLAVRVDDPRAWERFGRESASQLILVFNRMFEEGLAAGGKPDAIGQLMSDNFARLVALRKERYQAAATFRGLAFGLVVALAAAMAVGEGTIRTLGGALSGFDAAATALPLASTLFQPLDFRVVGIAVAAALVAHALAAALIVGILRGSHPLRAGVDFAAFTAAAALVLAVAEPLLAAGGA